MSDVEEILAYQSKLMKEALAKIDARFFSGDKLKDEKQRSLLIEQYNFVLDSYLSCIAIADGRIPDYFTQQFEARKAQIVYDAKLAMVKAMTATPPVGLPAISGAKAMRYVTEKLESELLSAAMFYDERLNSILTHAKLSEDGLPLYLYISSGIDNTCEECAASNMKIYDALEIDFSLPRHKHCKCVLVPFTEEVELELYDSIDRIQKRIDELDAEHERIQNNMFVEVVQSLLDGAGLIPVYGEIFDGINAIISSMRGNDIEAAFSAAAMVPGLGWTGTGSKYINKAAKYADEAAGTAAKAIKEAAQSFSKKLDNSLMEAAIRKATAGKAFRGGRAGEEILSKVLGGIPQQQIKTAITYRYIDVFSKGVIHESKVGYKAMSEAIKKQALKDSLIIAEKNYRGVWHFFRSETTGLVGADKRLLNLLDELGIEYYIYR